MSAQKNKKTGKTALIIGGFLVVVFLLLPFLTQPAQEPGSAPRKKAFPQIFTSNPLTDMVNKLYALFDHKPNSRTTALAARNRQQQQLAALTASDLAKANNEQAQTLQARNAAAPFDSSRIGSGSNSGVSYYGGQDPLAEEDWVLVRQTAPEGTPRGMHDVNSNDNAYDKYVNLERTARYIPGPSASAKSYPDSKLARLFSPIKNAVNSIFGRNEKVRVGPAFGQEDALASLGSSSGLGNGSRRAGSSIKAGGLDFGISNASQGMMDAYGNKSTSADILDALDLTGSVEKDIESWFEKDKNGNLNPQDKADKEALEKKIRQTVAVLQEKQIQQWDIDSQDQKPVTLENTIHCGISALYDTAPNCNSRVALEPEHKKLKLDFLPIAHAPAPDSTPEDIEAQRQKSIQAYSAVLGIPVSKPFNMVVILGKDHDLAVEQATEQANSADQALGREFYKYMMEVKNCGKQDCYWVANTLKTAELDDSIKAAGGNFLGDPLGVYQQLYADFQAKKQQALPITNDQNKDEARIIELQDSLHQAQFPYVAYTAKELAQLNERNSEASLKKDQTKGFLPWVHTAANVKEMKEALPNPLIVVYDKNYEVFNEMGGLSVAQRGEKLKDAIVERMGNVQELRQQLKLTADQTYLDQQLKRQKQEIKKQAEQLKKSGSVPSF